MTTDVVTETIFRTRQVSKVYDMGEVKVHALRDVDVEFYPGEFVVILGASGSGKSTLLNILGGLDVPTSGQVFFRDEDLTNADEERLTRYRRQHVGHWGGETTLQGTVRRVEPAAFLKVSALGVEERRVNVIIDFNEPLCEGDSLGDGFRIEARIVVDETAKKSIKVPSGALFRESGAWYAFKVVDNIATKTAVEVGLSNGLETEVIGGVDDSDVLISHPSDLIQDGAEVAPFD